MIGLRWPGLTQFPEPLLNLSKPPLNGGPAKRAAVLWDSLVSTFRHSAKISVSDQRPQLTSLPAAFDTVPVPI